MYHPNTLIKNITGKEIASEALIKYLDEKYLSIPWSPNLKEEMRQEWALNESLIKERITQKDSKQKVVQAYKNRYNKYHSEICNDLSYVPTEIQRDSQVIISQATETDNDCSCE